VSQITTREGKRWTAQDERLLRYYSTHGLTARQIGKKLGRTPAAVNIKISQLKRILIIPNERNVKTMYEDYDPGLCVGCEWCYYGSPSDCPQCKIIPEEDEDDDDDDGEE
jgi:DNA-binding CsgD family transcriptional regulator